MTDQSLRQRIVEFVADGVVEFGDLFEWAEEHLDLTAPDGDMTSDEYLEALIDDEPRLYDAGDGYRRLDLLLDSLVFTHRLDSEEIEGSVLRTHPDLALIDWDGTEALRTPDGEIVTNPVRDLALDGPDGWLSEFDAGDIVMIRRHDGILSIERAPGSLSDDATVLRTSFDSFVAVDGRSVQELAEVILAMASEDERLFRTPMAPVSELIVAAGLETQGEWIGEAGTDFSESGPVIADERLSHTIQRWGLQDCCIERLRRLLDVVRDGDTSEPREVVEALGHEAVVLALRDMLQGSGALGEDALRLWLDTMISATGRRAAPALTLRAFHNEVRGDVLAAEADMEQAHSYDPEFAPASVELAMYLTMRNEFKRAGALLNLIGSDGSAITDLFAGVHLDAAGVGRNDPCPCGSGRKYKACHLGKPITTPAAVVDALILKVRMFVTDLWRGASGLPVLALVASDGDTGKIGELYNDDFLQSLAMFEGRGIDDFVGRMGPLLTDEEADLAESWTSRSLQLFEVVSIDDEGLVWVRNPRSGETWALDDRELTTYGRRGATILSWLVPSGEGMRIAPPVLSLTEVQVAEVESLIDSGAGSTDWASWYGQQAPEA